MGSIQKDLFDLIYDVEKLRKLPANPKLDNPRFLQQWSWLQALGRGAGSRWDRNHRESQQVDPSAQGWRGEVGMQEQELQPAQCCRPDNNFIGPRLYSYILEKSWEDGGLQHLPGVPGRIGAGWACREILVWSRGWSSSSQGFQLGLGQAELADRSWSAPGADPAAPDGSVPWEAGAPGKVLADGITLCLSLRFPEEVFFQFFIGSSSFLLSISQRTGGYFFIFSCFFSMHLFIINMDQTPRVCQRGPALWKQPVQSKIHQHLYLLLLKETFSWSSALQKAQMSQEKAEMRSWAAPAQQEGKQQWNQCLDSAQDGQGQAEDAVEKEQPQGRKVCAGQSHCCLINPRITVIDENLVIGEASSLLAIYLQL